MALNISTITAPWNSPSALRQPLEMTNLLFTSTITIEQLWPTMFQPPDQEQSSVPAAFRIDASQRTVPITLAATFTFDDSWIGHRYTITGVAADVTIQSDPAEWGPAPGLVKLNATNFKLASSVRITMPFKAAGDWSWSIAKENAHDVTITSQLTTRLELYFFIGGLAAPFTKHSGDLLRIVVPSYALCSNIEQGNLAAEYASYLAEGLWAYGGPPPNTSPAISYHAFIGGGRSFYVSSNLGGSFKLFQWFARAKRYCNCYDLAGILFLACRALGTKPNANPGGGPDYVLKPSWQYCDPFGYIPAGPLFGWNVGNYRNLNSPFWVSANPAAVPHRDYILPQNDAARTYFSNHAFIQYELDANDDRVLDICHAIVDSGGHVLLSSGKQTLDEYGAAAIQTGYNDVGQRILTPGIGVQSLI